MFWIIVLAVFLVVCTALCLLVRSRNGGSGLGSGVDNHNALQNGSARIYSQHNRGDGPGSFGPGN